VLGALRARASRRHFLRLLGLALLVYGAVGLAASLYGYSLVREAFANVRTIAAFGEEKSQALRAMQTISAILDDASVSSTNLTSSFDSSKISLQTASEVSADVAANLRLIAELASFQIFGLQPMAAMAQPFQASSDRLDALSQDLTRTSSAMGANANDMKRLSGDFTRLKVEVDGLTTAVSRLPSNPTSGVEFGRLETALSAMLVWIGLQGLAAVFGGLALILLPFSHRS
jgi:hypothetical protein